MLFSLEGGLLKDAYLLPARPRFEPLGSAPVLLFTLMQRSAWRNCLKTPVSSKTRVPGGPEASKMGPFRRVMAAIPTLETPPSDFLDSFGREILRSPYPASCITLSR